MDIESDSSVSDVEEGINDLGNPDPFRTLERLFRSSNSAATTEHDEESRSDLVDYDVERSTEHLYLGLRLDRVSGIQCLDEGQTFALPLLLHSSVVFPGDHLPMIFSELDFLASGPKAENNEDGLLFGLVFPKTDDGRLFGVTCQIYEMNTALGDVIRMKSITRQRFEICRHNNPNWFDIEYYMNPHRLVANVKILPETIMCDPLFGHESNSLSKFRGNADKSPKLRRMCSAGLVWPLFVYDMYDIQGIIVKIKSFLSAMLLSKMPADEVALSYWCGKNVLMDSKERIRLFRTNSITERMLLISKSLDYSRFFVCKRCHLKLAHYNSLFAMSSEGFQSTYCNPNGFIHETNTVASTIPNAVYMQGTPTAKFSWFPGYSWQIALCGQCNTHLGWKFVAPNTSNLRPRKFYGLAGRSIALWNDRMVEDVSSSLVNNASDLETASELESADSERSADYT